MFPSTIAVRSSVVPRCPESQPVGFGDHRSLLISWQYSHLSALKNQHLNCFHVAKHHHKRDTTVGIRTNPNVVFLEHNLHHPALFGCGTRMAALWIKVIPHQPGSTIQDVIARLPPNKYVKCQMTPLPVQGEQEPEAR